MTTASDAQVQEIMDRATRYAVAIASGGAQTLSIATTLTRPEPCELTMGKVIPFPRDRTQPSASGVRVARISGNWFIERLEAGSITDRRPAPSGPDAQRIAARISRRDKVPLLPARQHSRPWDKAGTHTPDDAA
ncbi:hypothetical protein FV242_21880 [Methylobacterium sp. WL64]|uniref:hypothetical protein n=1 Tax=Methylobacterium sp. WL64 TaxID=2603894 RepID=UPI0011CC5011|nr:hypothetical protein [Methylobacterium sp. WL64]TXN00488.1 hypothetical protein FV242_21880 [Methylobacterium sp. WL64]